MNDNTVAVTSFMRPLSDISQLLTHRHRVGTPLWGPVINSGIILRTVWFKDLTFPGEEVSLQTLTTVEG